jgi:hypothetical protein
MRRQFHETNELIGLKVARWSATNIWGFKEAPKDERKTMPNLAAVTVQRREPQFIAFDGIFMVEGVLLQIEQMQIQDKPAIRYTVGGNGELYRFLGTCQINQKIHAGDIGNWVRIRCMGEEQPAHCEGHRMRE